MTDISRPGRGRIYDNITATIGAGNVENKLTLSLTLL